MLLARVDAVVDRELVSLVVQLALIYKYIVAASFQGVQEDSSCIDAIPNSIRDHRRFRPPTKYKGMKRRLRCGNKCSVFYPYTCRIGI